MAAIYTPLWPLEIYLTTTLYPIDVADSTEFSCAPVDETGWWPIPTEYGAGSMTVVSAALALIRFDAPLQGPEEGAGWMTVISAELNIVRFDAPLQGPEEGAGSFELISAELNKVRISCDTPDELLQISCSPTTDSTMTLA